MKGDEIVYAAGKAGRGADKEPHENTTGIANEIVSVVTLIEPILNPVNSVNPKAKATATPSQAVQECTEGVETSAWSPERTVKHHERRIAHNRAKDIVPASIRKVEWEDKEPPYKGSQPMAGPVSLIFYLDYLYGTTKGGIVAGTTAFDARTGGTGNETYSGDAVNGEAGVISSDSLVGSVAGALTRTPIRPGTVNVTTVTSNGTATFTDDGNGNLLQATGATETITAATVNYVTGQIIVNLSAAVTSGSITYRYDGEAADNVPWLYLGACN